MNSELSKAYADMGETIDEAEAAGEAVKWADALAHVKGGLDIENFSTSTRAIEDFREVLVDEMVKDQLVELGVADELTKRIMKKVEGWLIGMTAAELRRVYMSLGKMAAAECLRVAMLGDSEESIRAMAERLEISHTAVLKTIKKIRKRAGVSSFS